MQLWYEWDEQLQCNVFTSRTTMEPVYSEMYAEFHDSNDGTRFGVRKAKYRSQWSVGSDFPMDHFVFYLEEDEVNFVNAYSQYLVYDTQTPPRRSDWQRPADPEGFSWCDRCQVFHKQRNPNLPPIEEELIARFAEEISNEIDAEIVAELLRITKKE